MKKKLTIHHEEESNSERWLLTYADMITLLMVLFIVLFAMSTVNIKKFNSFKSGLAVFSPTSPSASHPSVLPGNQGLLKDPSLITHSILPQTSVMNLQQISSLIKSSLISQHLNQDVNLHIAHRGLVIRMLTDKVFFKVDSATLQPQGQQVVNGLGKILAKLPNNIAVEGYTDNQPIIGGPFSSNWELSAVRAVTVLHHLVHSDGIPPQKIHAVAYGSQKPRYSNTTASGRAKNRRVDVVILPLPIPTTSPSAN